MKTSYFCWNCCGLRKETDAFSCTCPNCESLMDRAPMDVAEIESVFPDAQVVGDGEFKSIGSLLSDAPDLLSYAMNADYVKQASEKQNLAALFVRPQDVPDDVPDNLARAVLVLCDEPQVSFFEFHDYVIMATDFYGESEPHDVALDAIIHPSAEIPDRDVVIGSGTHIDANVVIMPNTSIGKNTYIAPGTVVGMPGARLIKRADSTRFRALHAGGVRIGNNVFIGANSVIMKSVWSEPTTIEDGVYVGNLVNVGHNTYTGPGATLLPCSILCGRCRVEAGATVSLGAIVSNGVVVGENAEVTLGAVVTKDVASGGKVSGNFAVEHSRLIEHVKRLAQ